MISNIVALVLQRLQSFSMTFERGKRNVHHLHLLSQRLVARGPPRQRSLLTSMSTAALTYPKSSAGNKLIHRGQRLKMRINDVVAAEVERVELHVPARPVKQADAIAKVSEGSLLANAKKDLVRKDTLRDSQLHVGLHTFSFVVFVASSNLH